MMLRSGNYYLAPMLKYRRPWRARRGVGPLDRWYSPKIKLIFYLYKAVFEMEWNNIW